MKKNYPEVSPYGFRNPRFPLQVPIFVEFGEDADRVHEGRCIDLSEAGVGAQFEAELPLGSTVFLTFLGSKPHEMVRISSRVLYRYQTSYGFCFEFESNSQRAQVQEMLVKIGLLSAPAK